MASNKEIVALDDFEHVLLKPTIYVGSTEPSDEKIPIIKHNKILIYQKQISVGFYKLMNEIVDNAFDEAKRIKGKMKEIKVSFNSKTSEVIVEDFGEGFLNAEKINTKTNLSNVETAMTRLRAGSNFKNEKNNIQENLIGTNGVGASVVNMLSDKFYILTKNNNIYYEQEWEQFVEKNKVIRKRKKSESLGTLIKFIPRKDKFKKCKWDKEYINTLFTFKNFLKNKDNEISKVKFSVYFDDEKLNLDKKFIPNENANFIEFKYGFIILFPRFGYKSILDDCNENTFGTSKISYVNSAICSGTQERILNDYINEIFDFHHAYQYIDYFFVLELPPKLVSFGDQNKTKYDIGRWVLEPIFDKVLKKKVKQKFSNTNELFKFTKNRIEKRIKEDSLNSIKTEKRRLKKKHIISEKYIAPSSTKKCLFIVEGDSAKGSILQNRNPKTDGVYTLKGKIKNVRNLRDLSKNKEILDLMNILDIEPNKTDNCTYEDIIIATDWDPDGIGHIASLIINLFWRWFQKIINKKKLKILITPLVSIEINGKREYFYNVADFKQWTKQGTPYKNVRYLKGLGSLDLDDWKFVMEYRDTWTIYNDRASRKMLDIAFGKSSKLRKLWLKGVI